MASKRAKNQQLAVCLLSAHPMVLTEFQNLLAKPGVRLIPKLLRASQAGLRPEEVPSAQVYVIDAQAGEPVTSTLLRNILGTRPTARLLVVAETFTQESSYALLRGGAKGLLTYSEARNHLPKALSQVTTGGFWVPRKMLSGFVDHILSIPSTARQKAKRPFDLSSREQQVLEGVLDNLSNKEIASKLNISERTVKFHVSHLLEKFAVRRRADLIVLWYQNRSANV